MAGHCRLGWAALCAAALGWAGMARAAPPAQVACGAEARRELHVTAYRDGSPSFAFVREVREVELPAGPVSLSLADVPDTVERETVGMRVVEGAALEILEQTYGFDLLSPAALMRSAQGDVITLEHANAHTGELQAIPARVVTSGDQGTVLQTREGYTFNVEAERTRLSRLPPQLTARPTLRWIASSASPGKRRIELTYLVTGMSWSADYVATLSRDASRLELASWVTFHNDTAVRLERAQLGLMAGQVNRARRGFDEHLADGFFAAQTLSRAQREPVRESISELHLYKVPAATDLEARSVKNLHLLSLSGIPLRKRWFAQFQVHPAPTRTTLAEAPSVELEFTNDRTSKAGLPLPAGTVRIMAPDSRGTAHLVATSALGDTPEGERVSLRAGKAGDVRFVLKQTGYQSSWFGAKTATYELELRNRSRSAGSARVDLHAGGEVQLELTGAQASRPSAATWRIDVPLGAGQSKKILFTARLQPRTR